MQLHLPHPETGWEPWARGAAIVFGLMAVPVVLALIWLVIFRGVLF